jgi:hypothetical protein
MSTQTLKRAAITREFKVPLPNTLENVQKGDAVVVRSTEPLAMRVERKG